jgi:uncharacterized OB-fold protein
MTTVSNALKWTGPIPTQCPETAPFWKACGEGRFLVQICDQCGKSQYPYRAMCCHCWSSDVRDVAAIGAGTIWSYSVVRKSRTAPFSSWGPYVVAVIELPEGVKVVSNVVGCAPESVSIGMPVQLAFASAGERGAIPVFVPAQAAAPKDKSSDH